MTPEERAAEIVYHCGEPWADLTGHAKGYLRDQIANAIREAEDAVRERCAKIAEQRADFHRVNCHKSCSCADGWHIALSIRAQ